MSSTVRYIGLIVASIMAFPPDLRGEDIHLRAGTLLQCTLHEPNFSSHSAKVGEPLTCHARPLREFGRLAIPHGAYFVGHLESYRDPGRFIGKGWIRLEFDRLILPNSDVPISSRVISAGNFSVDNEGRILGRGHPTRDALGWVIPLLWPVKLITLPMRGPRTALKGELVVTLRLLDDVPIPRDAYLTSANPNRKQSEVAKGARRQSWDRSEERQRTSSASVDDVIKVRPRVQDRYRMPYRFEDRYRNGELWRGWVAKPEAETRTGPQ